MHTEQPRHASGAIIFVSLVAMIVIGIGTVAFAVMSATGQSQSGSASQTTTIDRTLGLELSLMVSPDLGPSGTVFQVNASVTNILPGTNNVTGLGDYKGVGSNPICKFAPIAFDVLQGYYTPGNYTSGEVVDVHGPQVYMCVIGGADLGYYVFQPNSDNFTGAGSSGIVQSRTAHVSVDVSQVWSDGSTGKAPLPPGQYTVVAADNWGQLAIVHFTVSY
ncbi:MAG: hypothetical protein OK474_02650 [Thaumarchaeota archaeon]|nr:hypothetical protein [Nitrososphaerota archaeon]